MAHRKTSSMATTVNVDALRDRARALEALIIAEVGAFKVSGKLAIRRQEYLIRPDFNLWYSVDPTLMNFEMATTEEDDWHWKDLESFLESQILEHEVCSQVTQVLQDGGRDTHLVRAFASRIAYDAALKETPELEQHIATLLRDATDSPLEYRARLWLTGITLDEDVVDVSDSLSFRRPTREDLQERVRAEAVPYAHAGFSAGSISLALRIARFRGDDLWNFSGILTNSSRPFVCFASDRFLRPDTTIMRSPFRRSRAEVLAGTRVSRA